MPTTLEHLAMAVHGKVVSAEIGCSVAALETTTRRTCARPTATGTPRITATTTTVSVLPAPPLPEPCHQRWYGRARGCVQGHGAIPVAHARLGWPLGRRRAWSLFLKVSLALCAALLCACDGGSKAAQPVNYGSDCLVILDHGGFKLLYDCDLHSALRYDRQNLHLPLIR